MPFQAVEEYLPEVLRCATHFQSNVYGGNFSAETTLTSHTVEAIILLVHAAQNMLS